MSILTMTVAELVAAREFDLSPLMDGENRVTFFDKPDPEGVYVCGSDFAYGLEGRDWDTGIILRKDVTPRPRQVATIKGRWGTNFHRVLYAGLRYWCDCFLLGERQVGLFTMQILWGEYGFRRIYRERIQEKPGQPHAYRLGHPRVQDDHMLRKARRAVMDHSIDLLDEELIDQMGRLKFHSPKEVTAPDEKVGDATLKLKLSGGGSPDLVMGFCYAVAALDEVTKYEKPKPRYTHGTYGHDLGMERDLHGEPESEDVSWVKR